jgi:hypothetical protein
MFGAQLRYRQGIFFARGDFMMLNYWHSSSRFPYPPESEDPEEEQRRRRYHYTQNNGGISVEAGAAWGLVGFLDSLTVSAGAIMALDREDGSDRFLSTTPTQSGGVWYAPAGGFINAYAARWIFGARGFLYVGEPLRMLYGNDQWARDYRFGTDGSPVSYSHTEVYGRLDLMAQFTVKDRIHLEFAQAFHIHHNHDDPWLWSRGTSPIGYSQHFLLRADFGGSWGKR